MKKFSFPLCAALLFVMNANAKIRRVGFFGSPVSGTDYANFAAAYTAAASGDTILMFPNTTVNGTIAKKLMLAGPGYWLDPNSTPKGNSGRQAFAGVASISSITLDPGSAGTVITGFNGGNIYVRDNDIVISRNFDVDIFITFLTPAGAINNLQVLQNYRVSINQYYNNGSSSTNMNISNNLMKYFSTPIGNTYSGNISNNVWAYDATQTTGGANGGASTLSGTNGIDLGAGAYLLQNNIFVSYTNASAGSSYNYFSFVNGGNSVFNYNMALQTSTATNWGVGTGNITTPITNAPNIFNAFPAINTASADARYQLKTGSPALTAGAGNTAIGMYAGSYPYKLSGIPAIPSIYALSSPQGNNPSGNTIQISVSTRGNN